MAEETKKTILITEDEAPLCNALAGKLKREGFEVLEAKNGKEGLEIALSAHPDLLLVDVMMPVMDGMTMFRELRKDAWGKSAKVIMLTNLGDAQNVAGAMEQGSYDYFVKSDWKIKDVVEKIKEKLGK